MDFEVYLFFLIAIFVGFAALAIVLSLAEKKQENDFEQNANSIRIGMTYSQVVAMMGGCEKISRYKDGSYRCVWTYKKRGYSYRVAKGIYSHSRGYTLKLTVKFDANNTVIEVVNT
jgi:phage-related protein